MSDNNLESPHAGLNILVVHSDPNIGGRIHAILSAVDYGNIIIVGRARDALGILRKQPVDVLICDIDLDELDGWRISRLVRSDALRCKSTIPIIVTTSTWCERIAEVTARDYGISGLVAIENLQDLPQRLNGALTKSFKPSKPSVLVVEDEEDTADLISRILSQRFDVEIAADGELGLHAWVERRHDLVLLDVMLPKLDGPGVLSGIMTLRSNQPVVIMTAHAPVEQAEDLLIRGASDFIVKPFRPEQLRTVAEVALRRDDYMVINHQFAERVRSLSEREAAYREMSEEHKHLLNNLQTVVMELDAELNITFLNEAWQRVFGFEVSESLNCPFRHFLDNQDGRKFRAIEGRFRSVLSGDKDHCELELVLQDSNERQRWAQFRVSRSSRFNHAEGLTICIDDITRSKQAQKQLEFMAMHDSLTGLYNRNYFKAALKSLWSDTQTKPQGHGLLYIDLDYFKVINDTFGHHRGDQVLKQVAEVITKQVREADVLCRFGGDEFALILHNLDAGTLVEIAEKIKDEISVFVFTIGKQTINLGCSIGISIIDGSASDGDGYLIQADVALYVAKHRGRNSVHVYNPADGESDELKRNVDWARQIRQAMAEDRLVLHFQPIMHIATNRITYHEALVRMLDKDNNIIMPGKFIAALESTGDMGLLDRWVIKRAITLLSKSSQLKKIAINLSAQAFRDENLVPIIRESLSDANVDGSMITFELTESASLLDLRVTQKVIDELHQLGCSFAVDDFGSGFSSFAYLKELPADYIKLDGSFIRNLHVDKVDQALVRSIIDVVQTLGRKTVAEFVENKEILDFLRENGVDYAQGYFIGKPVAVEHIVNAVPLHVISDS
ncbi:MAG: diguanylate cyclase (GGDEF)-like protein/PAS domain S-box-containing protein [Cellvibrionaceae bacterium]|jgi:diguanylate cyclase (GGDEF)-like protein/PAS domain S-box-containing protein